MFFSQHQDHKNSGNKVASRTLCTRRFKYPRKTGTVKFVLMHHFLVNPTLLPAFLLSENYLMPGTMASYYWALRGHSGRCRHARAPTGAGETENLHHVADDKYTQNLLSQRNTFTNIMNYIKPKDIN